MIPLIPLLFILAGPLDTAVKWSFVPAIAAHTWDLGTTVECRTRGTCQEVNPLLRWADSTAALSLSKGAMAGALQLIPYSMWKRGGRWKWAALGYNLGQTIAFSYIAHRNGRFSKPR